MSHALLSPSSSERWTHCSPSARAEEKIPEKESGYAAEGTLAHAIAETLLKKGSGYKGKLKTLKASPYYYNGMDEELKAYVDFCNTEKANLGPATVMRVEQKLDLTPWIPDGFGTGDCVLVSPSTIHVIDLKFGKGVFVPAFQNKQLMLYALGALEANGFIFDEIETVKMTIAQVRLDEINTYMMPVKDLIAWGDTFIKPHAQMAYKGEGVRQPGAWCRFCKAKTTCKPYAEWVTQGAVPEVPPDELSDEDIAIYLKKADLLMEWAKDLKAYALDRALAGTTFDGWKVVAGRSTRKVKDPEEFATRLKEEGFAEKDIYKPTELQGITVLTRLMGKKKFDEIAEGYLEKPEGKPTLVPEDDKRPAIGSAEADFTFMEETK